MNMKRWVAGFVSAGVAVSVGYVMIGCAGRTEAQSTNQTLDVGVAVMAMRSMVSAQTLLDLQRSPQYIQNYQSLIVEQELAQEAIRRGLTERIDVQQMVEIARRGVLIQALREDNARKMPPPTDGEIKARYDRTKAQWVLPEAFKLDVYRIQSNDVVALNRARALADKKPHTNDLALVLGTNVTPVVLQSQGWVTSANMTPEVWEGVRVLEPNTVGVFPDGPSHLLVRRGPNRGEQQLTMDQVRSEIGQVLTREKEQQTWQTYLEDKRKGLNLK